MRDAKVILFLKSNEEHFLYSKPFDTVLLMHLVSFIIGSLAQLQKLQKGYSFPQSTLQI